MFSATAEPEMSRYEDDEDIDAAKMPDTTKPHINDGKIMFESTIKMLSALAWVKNCVGMTARPIRPIETALNNEITTHTVAIRRDLRSSLECVALMKRIKTWGMPK